MGTVGWGAGGRGPGKDRHCLTGQSPVWADDRVLGADGGDGAQRRAH